jgi:AcrR family transcriptional regulator
VRAAQRERLLRSVIAAVAASGIGDVSVADIVRGARVSKADKEDCFLAATREGGKLMIDRVAAAGRHQPARLSAEAALRASIAAFLGFLADEPAFARAFYIDMPATGPRAVQRLEAAGHSFARMTRAWHERARREHPSWPAVPYEAYLALSGATAELVRSEVRHGKIGAIPALEDTLVALHLAVLAAQPWPGSPPPARPLPLASQAQAYRSSKSRSGPPGPPSSPESPSSSSSSSGGRAADRPPGKAARGRGCSR